MNEREREREREGEARCRPGVTMSGTAHENNEAKARKITIESEVTSVLLSPRIGIGKIKTMGQKRR